MDPFFQNSNDVNATTYTSDKAKQKKIWIIVGCIVVAIAIAFATYLLQPQSDKSKYIESATAAARKQTPNAVVGDITVADGFALASVRDPTAKGQANSGNTTVFKVNDDGSMTQIANGSFFTPIDFLGLGIPLAAQAKLTGNDLNKVKQDLAATCGYIGGNAPSYSGFGSSFNPNGGKIDPLTLDSMGQTLTRYISNKNSTASSNDKVICVNAIRKGSDLKNDPSTIVLQFITSSGTLTDHTLTYVIEPHSLRTFTLDGQKLGFTK